MEYKRIGNDIRVAWSILKEGVPFNLDGISTRLYLKDMYGRKKVTDFTVSGNVVNWVFFGSEQKHTGKYSLVLVINEGQANMITTDACDFVNLTFCDCNSTDNTDVAIESELGFVGVIVDNQLNKDSHNAISNKAVTDEFISLKSQIVTTKGIEDAIGYYDIYEDITQEFSYGYWLVTSDGEATSTPIHGIGESGIATKKQEGAWRSIEHQVKAGERYIISGTGGVHGRLYLVLDNNNVITQEAEPSLTSDESIIIKKDGKLYCSFFYNETNDFYVKKAIGSSSEIDSNKERIKNNDEKVENLQIVLGFHETTEDLTSKFTGLNYVFSETNVGSVSIPTEEYKGFRGTKVSVNKGDKLIITGTGGSAVRLYCLVDNDNIIQKIASIDQTLNNHTILVETDGLFYFNSSTSNADMSLKVVRLASSKINDVKAELQDEINNKVSKSASLVNYFGFEINDEELGLLIKNGYWKVTTDGESSSPAIHGQGESGVATKIWDGTWRSLEYSVKEGEQYRISGTSSTDARLYLVLDKNGIIQQESEAFLSGSVDLVINTDGTLYCSFFASEAYSVIKKNGESRLMNNVQNNISELTDEIGDYAAKTTAIEEYLGYSEYEQDLGDFLLNGYWTMSSYEVGTKAIPEKVWDGGWRSIEYSVKEGEKYKISGTGGLNGRLYILLDSTGYVQAVSPSGAEENDFVLNIKKNGTLYCSFAINGIPYSITKYTKQFNANIGGGLDSTKGSYEFGRTCNLDYTCPEIAPWPWPNEGERVATINSYYDELMAEFPLYISKVNCDEVMESLGVTKPDAIKNAPMNMYKFLPPRTPEGSKVTSSIINRIKVFILTGTHPEFTAVWDMINAMRLVCRSWRDDKNLEELRWNADIYIIPCLNQYGLDYGQRTNENGVDINRNAPTSDWVYQGVGTQTFSGTEPASEYSTKVLVHFLNEIKPDVFIDHHATNVGDGDDEGDGKNMIYVHSTDKLAIDVGGVLISQMTRKWRDRYADTFPSVEEDPLTIFGFSTKDTVQGSLSKYASENGSFGSTYESNFGILYKNKEYGTANRQTNTPLVNTCATEGWINYLVRLLTAYSEMTGVK